MPRTAALLAEDAPQLVNSLLESSTEYSIIGTDLEGTILLWNEGARRLYGYDAEEVIATCTTDLLHIDEDVHAGLPESTRQTALTEGKWEGMLRRQRRDGSHFPARVVMTPRRNGDGDLVGFLLISKDISQEVRLTEQLEATQFYTRSLIESNVDALMTTDPLGIITDVNGEMEALTGHGRDALIGTPFKQYFTDPDRAENGIRLALTDGKVTNYELTAQHADGRRTTVSYNASTFNDHDGRLEGVFAAARDVTEHKALEERLRRSESYNRGLIEASVDGLVTVERDGTVSDVNEQMCRMTGYRREDLIGTAFAQYFDDPEAATRGVAETFQRGLVTDYVLHLARRDGQPVTVSFNASVFRAGDGQVQGIFASARDITEQDRLQSQLAAEREYNRGLIEASVDGLVTVERDGSVSDVNEQMCRMTGYRREDLIGTAFAQYFQDPEVATRGVAETFQRGLVTDYVLHLARRDGQPGTVSFNASVFRAGDGQVQGIFASARDITEQDRLQSQLAAEREYNRGLIEASLDGLVTVDPMLRISDVNEQMCRMTGYRREELVGSAFPDYFTDHRRAADGVRLTLDQGEVTSYELTLRASDGREALVSFNASVFRTRDGQVQGIFASARDITAQAGLAAQLAEEQAYNRGLIEASVDGLVTVDDGMVITDVNETMATMVGRPRNQLIGTPFADYFTESERATEGVRLTFAQGQVTNYVLTLAAAGGRRTPVSFNAAVFADSAGHVRGIFASARDITAQQELEERLRQQQAYTRSLIESNVDALMTTDPLGVVTDVNGQMEALTGRSRSELVGSPFKQYFTDPERAEDGIRLVLREGKVTNYELTARHADGAETVVSYNAATFFDQDGRLEGVFAAARAVADQKLLEQQLREQQTYLRGLIESSVDGLVTVDREGFVSDVNEQMCRMTGYSRAELVGTRFADYFTDPEQARAGVQQTFDEGIVTEYALTIVSRARRLLQVSFNASVFTDIDGTVRGIFASARDITDRVRLEEAMSEQQTYLRGLIESSIDGLVTVDPDGYITDVNDQMCRMSGYSRENLIGSVFAQYFTDPGQATMGVRRTLAEGVVTNYELVLTSSSGRKATVSFNASVFRGAEGDVQGIFASARDISEQARLQRQLVEEQAYNRSLIEASADALFAIAPDGVITDVNEEATRLTGYSRKHLLSSMFCGYFTEPERATAGVRQTFDQGRALDYELTIVTRHGRRMTVSFNAGVFSDATGSALGILASARDITAQKQLEQQLRDSQVYTRSLIESNIDALMTTDPLGIITDVNGQMEELTGRSRQDLVGSPFKQYFTDPARAEDGVRQVLREGKVTNYELTARHLDGQETVVSYNASTFLDPDGRLQGVFAAARDVTDRKRFEETLQEKNLELENASQAKDRFLASMSHELRTPLNAILGFTGTLLMKLPGPLNEVQESQLGTVRSSAKHLLSIINDLLDLAKIDSGKIELALERVSCRSVVTEVLGTLQPLAEAKHLTLDAEMPPGEIRVRTDRRALQQILINFVNNAIKFTEEGSVLIQVRHDENSNSTTVSVIDTGPGIAPDDQQRLFQAFEKLTVGPTRDYEGTGLGLYISERLAQLLGARLSFQSAPGQGSTFAVTVPGA